MSFSLRDFTELSMGQWAKIHPLGPLSTGILVVSEDVPRGNGTGKIDGYVYIARQTVSWVVKAYVKKGLRDNYRVGDTLEGVSPLVRNV